MKRILSTVALIAIVFAACNSAPAPSQSSAPAGSGTPSESGPVASEAPAETGDIVVWIDATRQPAVDAFKAANPDVASRIKETVVDYTQLPAKVLLFNNAGSGWPDVSFGNSIGAVAQLADASRDYPLDLRPYIDKTVLDKFTEGANDICTLPDQRLVCLRNDIAQNVLWYNKPLMEQFGYTVPTTWEEYTTLGERLAKEHPGYVIGGFGGDGNQVLWQYFWASRCPTGQNKSATQVYINLSAPECTRVVDMLDRLIAAGTIAKFDPFDPEFVKIANNNKLLMIEAGNWYGEYIFGGKPDSLYYKKATGQLGVAPPLKWASEDKAYTGATGGGVWFVSKHTESPKLATKFAEFVSTDLGLLGSSPGFPGYAPAIDAWAKTISTNPIYAADPTKVIADAAKLIDPLWGDVRYNREATFSSVVIAAVNAGNSVASAIPTYQEQLVKLAESTGYEVVTTP
jgi:ABC-type glycerol-3-phosphate transport system substrate-binding protein